MTNLPPQAAAQYKRVLGSRTPEEKLQNLKLYLSMIPRHKGTEKLQRQVRRQISELEDEIVQRRSRRAKARRASHFFEKSKDSPLVALIGRTQSGKSTLLATLTSARPHITGLPFATQIRIERALQHSGLGIGIYEVDAAYSFFLYGSVLLSSAIMAGLVVLSAVQRSFDVVLFGLPYVLTAFYSYIKCSYR